MNLDICMASDDNYAVHLGICIVSIMENNSSNINMHILDNNISEVNLNKLKSLEDKYPNLTIIFYKKGVWNYGTYQCRHGGSIQYDR